MASGNSLVIFTPQNNEPPAASFATLDTRNGHLVLDFDGATDEEAVFTAVMPANYAGGGLTVKVHVAFTSATSGTVNNECMLERIIGLDIDADSFAAMQDVGVTANGTSGIEVVGSITFTAGAQMDSIVAGEFFLF